MSELIIERALPDQALEPVGDGWTVYGRAVPYGIGQRVTDDGAAYYTEEWARRAFSRDAEKGGRWVNLFAGHRGDDGDRYLGRCVELTEKDDGLYAAFRLNRSHPLAEEARAGELTGWSVGAKVFRTRETHRGGDVVKIRELAGLNHVAATASPQYAGTGVLVARDHELITDAPTPLRDTLRARLDALRAAR
jgi:HK97 family phage prohead protease